MRKIRARIILDAKSKEEKKSIFLAVTHERTTRQYSLGIDVKLTKDEFSNHRLKVGHLHNHVGLTENFDQSENEEFLVNDSP